MDKEFNAEYLETLAHKWKTVGLDEEELAYFDRWYNEYNDELLELPEGYAANPLVIRDRMHKNLMDRVRIEKGTAARSVHLWRKLIAAAVVAFMIVATGIIFLLKQRKKDVASPIITAVQVRPGGHKAILTLGDGSVVALNGKANGTVAEQSGIKIIKTAEGRIVYTVADKGNTYQAGGLNTITTPKGGQYQIVLPDGSKVFLNAASVLKYPAWFAGKERKVELTGEAYFEVAHNKHLPFIVKTATQEVKVLGTEFNINSYRDEGRTVTTLAEGSIQVNSGSEYKRIRPGQQAIVLGDKNIVLRQANLQIALAWKNNKMSFQDAGIEEIMRQVARWYDLDISYEGSIPDDTFTGSINRQSDLSAVLRMFEASQIKFSLVEKGNRKTLIIKP